jgi:hypothetical protein
MLTDRSMTEVRREGAQMNTLFLCVLILKMFQVDLGVSRKLSDPSPSQ